MRAVILACFFLSGASGLILEMLWTRMLTLVFGSTTLAVSTVLTAFMGGLGLGSYLAGRFADRLKTPVRAYAAVEASVGLYALLVPVIISFYPSLNRWLWAAFGDRYALLSVLRFVASAGLLLLPTTLMGATLPILARHFVQHPWELRRVGLRIGTLYAVNLFGAVAGSFFAGFVFLPVLGLRWTNVTAAAFNVTLAGAVLLARRLVPAVPSGPTMEALLDAAADRGEIEARALPPEPLVDARSRRVALGAFIVSGATAMTLQVMWTRALAVLIGSSIFSFTIILVAFLIGLGVGSALFGRLSQRTAHPVRWLAGLHLGIALAVGVSYLCTDRLPFVFTWLLKSTSFGVDTILVCQFVLACVTVLPATILMGGVFPLTVRIAAPRLESVGRDIGNAYALNTIGAIVGSFLSGFVVLPKLGLQRGIYASVLGGLAVAAALAAVAPGWTRARRAAGIGAACALAVLGLVLPRWNLVTFSSGFFRVSIAREYISRQVHKKAWQDPKLVFYEDGTATTVSVDQWGKMFSLKNNGKVDASNDSDMATQIVVGLLPLLLYEGPTPPKVALVGFGSGVTAGAITQYPIASLEVVELEPAIYRASHFFDNDNHRPLENPKVTARVGDGRNFLTQRSDKFDVLVSQPSNPWLTGVSNLFTREYFRDIKTRLAPHGLFCQWAQLYEMSPWNIKTIYRTLREEFPYVYVFAAEDLSSDTILIASEEPIKLDLATIERAFRDPVTRAEARRAGFSSPHDVVSYLLLGPDELESFTAGSPDNTDDNALIEFSAPRDLLGYAKFDPYLAKVYGPMWPYGRLTELVQGYDGPNRSADRGLLGRSLLAHGKAREAELWTRRAEASGDSPEARHARLLLRLVSTRMDRDPEIPLAPDAGDPLVPPVVPAKLAAAHPDYVTRVADEYRDVLADVAARRYATAYKLLDKWPEALWTGLGQDFALLSGFLDYKAEFYSDAVDTLKPLADDASYVARRPEVLYYLGRAHYASAAYGKAVDALERFVRSQRVLDRSVLPASDPASAAVAAPAPSPCDIFSAMSASNDRVVGLGQVMVENLGVGPRSPEAVVELSAFSMQAGGAIGTTLAAVCALGGQARYIGRLSDDDLGRIALRGLKEFGVDVSSVLIEPGRVSPASFILVDDRTARRMVRYTRGNTTPLQPGELPRDMLDGARALVVDGRGPAPQIAAAERAKALGLTVVLDARHLGPGMGELLGLCDVVIGNERFAAEFSHSADMKRSLTELVKMGPRTAVITLGEEGAIGLEGDTLVRQPALDIDVIDTTGASEVFRGAFIYGLLKGWGLDRCLPAANAAAGLNCRHLGGLGGIAPLSEILEVAGLA